MTNQQLIEEVSEEIKQDLENNGIPRELVSELRDRLAEKWFNTTKLWYAVPQKTPELRQADLEILQQAIDKYLTAELQKQVEESGGWENYCIKEAFKELAEEDIKLMESLGVRA